MVKLYNSMDSPNTQYDSFQFWRQPIPELDLCELEELGLLGREADREDEEQEEDGLAQYNTFNYWREPIASIDTLDFSLLL